MARGDDAVPPGLAAASAVALRLLILAVAVGVLAWAAWKLLLVVVPVVVALLLTTLLAPLARRLERAGVPPAAAAMLVVLGAVLVVVGIFALIVPAFAGEVGELRSSVATGVETIGDWLTTGPLNLSPDAVDRATDRVVESLQGSGGQIASGVLSGATIAAGVVAAVLLTLVLTFFFVKDGADLWTWQVELWDERRRPHARALGDRMWAVLSAYFRGVAFVALVDATFIGVGLLVVGVPLAMPLIALTFLATFFPIVGAFVAGAAAVLVALVAQGVVAALIILGVVLLVQQLEGNVLYPMVVGRSLPVHPVTVLLALTAGGVIGGVAGAFLAVPVAALLGAILAYARDAR